MEEPQSADVANRDPVTGAPSASGSGHRVVYAAREHETVDVPISQLLSGNVLDLYPDIVEKGFFTILLTGGRLALQARGFVGLIPVNDRVAIEVSPRIPVTNLVSILAAAETSLWPLARHLRSYSTGSLVLPSILDLFADALVDAVQATTAQAIHHEYSYLAEETSFPRGRILVGETMKRASCRGALHRVSASWFHRTSDTAVNRCLKYAIWCLAQKYLLMSRRAGTRSRMSGLNRTYRLLDCASLDLSKAFLSDPVVLEPERLSTAHKHYGDALRLAKAITGDSGVSFAASAPELRLASLLIKMDDVFEAYLRNSLRIRLSEIAPGLRVLDGRKRRPSGGEMPLFDNVDQPVANPDIVVCRDCHDLRRTTVVLIEVKYRRRESAQREDINQALAYAAAYRSPRVVIALPRYESSPQGLQEIGRVGTALTLYQYYYDLGHAVLADEEIAFARSILELATQ